MTKMTMNRIAPIDLVSAKGRTKELFERVKAKCEFVPNLLRVFGTEPAVLEGYLGFNGALASGSFSVQLREQISLAVAEANLCSYSLSVHAFIGARVGLTRQDISAARKANAATDHTDAILKLARSVVVLRGEISDADFGQARASGLTDSEIVETVANVALNTFLIYMTHVARPLLDFPEVRPGIEQGETTSEDQSSSGSSAKHGR
jgi:uncharacterized peroxidase-related enzyme